jgi:hypothetical protein
MATMNRDPETGSLQLGPLAQIVAAILWPAFISSVVASVVFFVNIDPETLRLATFPEWQISREFGYTIGFFMFWGVTSLSSFLTWVLLYVRRSRPQDKTLTSSV